MRNTFINISSLVLLAILSCGCSGDVENPASPRQKLTFEEMMAPDSSDTAPILNDYFMPAENAAEALHAFSGALTIPELAMKTGPVQIEPAIINGKATQSFPGVTIEFFSDRGYLVPVARGLLEPENGKNFWMIQFEPGRVWSEAGDKGYSRASFPFMLTGDVEGDAYNGVATFIYNENNISQLRYQVVQQSSPYFVKNFFVAWGHVSMDFEPGTVDGRERLSREFRQELADRIPRRDWTELEAKYDPAWFSDFDSSIDPALVTTSGLVIDGVVYARPSRTPFGDYPYPEEMRHGVWSVTKSALGMVAMLRVAQKYGDDIFDLKIRDYLDVTAVHDGWDEVTFGDALNMATGIGGGSDNVDPNNILDGYITGDEESYNAWYLAPGLDNMLTEVFKMPSYPWGSGEHARYCDRNTFTLAAALNSLLKSKEGEHANLWQMMTEEVYGPIGIHHMSTKFTVEPDGSQGVPFLGWALFMTVDDIAKISMLLQNGGRHNDEQILSPGRLAEALYQTEKRGLPTGASNEFGDHSYHMSFWHTPYTGATGFSTSVPEMHGWGGMLVCLMPNGITGFRIGNGGTRSLEMIKAADRIMPFAQRE
jgi:CubicO group peptidase (beta-lactamase class C family)